MLPAVPGVGQLKNESNVSTFKLPVIQQLAEEVTIERSMCLNDVSEMTQIHVPLPAEQSFQIPMPKAASMQKCMIKAPMRFKKKSLQLNSADIVVDQLYQETESMCFAPPAAPPIQIEVI